MKRQRQFHRLLLLVIISVSVVFDLTARTLPGVDGYIVDIPARTLPNGMVQPAQAFVMTRPEAASVQSGVVYVMTKKTFGMVKGERTLANSAVNLELQGLKVSDVSLAMAPGSVEAMVQPAAVASGLDRLYVVRYEDALDPFDLCKRLMDNPDVEYAAPARVHQLSFTPNDARYAQQGFLNKIKVPQAWDITKGSASVLIAIIDTGVDWMHEDLAANIWKNPGEIASNGIDDDHNGYVDDVRGWDFVGNVSAAEAQNGILRPDNDPRQQGSSWTDQQGHGTVVAGNAAAVTNNTIGVSGIASNCKILPIKIGSDNPSVGGLIQGYPAIKYAADLGASVINCSWGGYGADPVGQTFIDYAISKGAVVVAAAGNNGLNMNNNVHTPACYAGVLSVGSVDGNDRPSYFSNYGYANITYAPGEYPLSTFPGNQYKGLPGTSFSCPVVAGIVALVRSVHPDWTPQQVVMQIRMTNDPVVGIPAANKPLYFGRVNAERAVKTNAAWTGGDRVSGVGLSSVSFDGATKITSYDPITVHLNLKNLLADAKDVIVNLQFADPHVELLSSAEIVVGDMARNQVTSADLRVKVKSTYPWFSGFVNVGLNIRVGATANFTYVSIPVELPTTNTYNGSGAIEGITFTQATFADNNVVWGSGVDQYGRPFLIRGSDVASSSFSQLQLIPTAIDALTSSTGAIGGVPGGQAYVMTTTNGGGNWSSTSVGGYASSVDAIKLYDANNAIFVGSGANKVFGVGKTTNAGATWTQITTAPLFTGSGSTKETVSPRGVFFLRDNIWIGTSTGRVVRTTNRGTQWSVVNAGLNGGVVESLAFRDSLRGVMLYRTSAEVDAPKRLAHTLNGGGSWTKNTFDLATLGVDPVFVSSPGGHIVLVGHGGETFGSDDEGTTWQQILTKPSGAVVTGEGLKAQSKNALLYAGSQIGVLTYHYAGPNSPRILAFDVPVTDYGIIDAGKTRQKLIKVTNTGSGDATVSKVVIVPDVGTPATAFVVSVPLKTTIEAQDVTQLGIRCSATDTGSYGATVYIISNATPDTIQARVIAHVQIPVSVDDSELGNAAIAAWPNPAQDFLNIAVSEATNSLTLVNSIGTVILTASVDHAAAVQQLDISLLPSGTYRLLFTSNAGSQSLPLVIAR